MLEFKKPKSQDSMDWNDQKVYHYLTLQKAQCITEMEIREYTITAKEKVLNGESKGYEFEDYTETFYLLNIEVYVPKKDKKLGYELDYCNLWFDNLTEAQEMYKELKKKKISPKFQYNAYEKANSVGE